MYRNKPFIIFIPDADDKNIVEIYDEDYSNIINGFKNNSIKFEYKYFIYYVKNNFHLDLKLKILYKQFNFNYTNSINSFIKYLISL